MTDMNSSTGPRRPEAMPMGGDEQGDPFLIGGKRDAHLLAMLSVSSGMVGACLTAIGLVGVIKSLNRVETLVDDCLAVATLFFALAAAFSFVGMRTDAGRRRQHLVRRLDLVFCAGLLLVVMAATLLTWMVMSPAKHAP